LSGVINVSAIECAKSRQVGVGARRVDDHEVVAVFDRGDGFAKLENSVASFSSTRAPLAARDPEVHRQLKVELGASGPGPVFST
jgi:hypothetical protein